MENFVYLIGSHSSKEALVVDPAWQVQRILDILAQDDMQLKGMLITHTHFDHVGGDFQGNHVEGVEHLMEKHPTRVYVHKAEANFAPLPMSELVAVENNHQITLGKVVVQCIHTPGHTPGSQCFKLDDRLVAGDTLFIGSCGRTDLPGGDAGELYDSLTQKLMKLEENTLVFPGHNYAHGQCNTTIMAEKKHNPFFGFSSRSAFLAAMGY